MRRLLPLVAIAIAALAACGEKKGTDTAVDNSNTDPGTTDAGPNISIDLGEEESDPEVDIEINKATASCGNLVALEPAAMMGKLKDAEVRCLEDALRAAEKQTA